MGKDNDVRRWRHLHSHGGNKVQTFCYLNGHVGLSLRYRSKTSASFSSGVPNTKKKMKARRRRRSAFIVSRCLEPLMKNEARVFELASQMKQ